MSGGLEGQTKNDWVTRSSLSLNLTCSWSSNATLLVYKVISATHSSLDGVTNHLFIGPFTNLVHCIAKAESEIPTQTKFLMNSIPNWLQILYALLRKLILLWGTPKCISHCIQVLCCLKCKIVCCLLPFRYVLVPIVR
jgi:hypothetical protein